MRATPGEVRWNAEGGDADNRGIRETRRDVYGVAGEEGSDGGGEHGAKVVVKGVKRFKRTFSERAFGEMEGDRESRWRETWHRPWLHCSFVKLSRARRSTSA